MKKFISILFAILLFSTLFGCNMKKDKVVYEEPAPPQKEIEAKKRPEKKQDVLQMEGLEEKMNFILYDDPNLEFTTYIPEDMIAESKEGDFLTIYSNFNNVENKDAKLLFFSPPKTVASTTENMKNLAVKNLIEEGFEVTKEKKKEEYEFDFSTIEMNIFNKEKNIAGTLSVFNHNERIYYLILQYPVSLEEGFVPRAEKIINHIMYYDERMEENK